MLVVGSRGRFNHACCALMRSANGDLRWSALAGRSARRLATSARWISLLLARESAAALAGGEFFGNGIATFVQCGFQNAQFLGFLQGKCQPRVQVGFVGFQFFFN